MGTTYSPASRDERQWTVLERDGYRFPPGLQLNLPFYLLRRFFKPANPIALFEHLTKTYGRMAHYRLGLSHIVFINEPEFIHEILINQPQHFIKERTQRRMKILLGEGLITRDGVCCRSTGSRQCIGEAFGWMEGVLMAATIAQQWRLRFVPGQTVEVQPKITLRPKYPMMFVPEPR